MEFEYKLDNIGRPVEICYLGADGQYLSDSIGVAKRKYEYNQYEICKTEYCGINDEPVLNEQLWTSYIRISDKNGNMVEERFFGTDGNPCLHIYGKIR